MTIECTQARAPLSPAIEDYLKTIYTLHCEERETSSTTSQAVVTTQALANRMGVAAPSATAMVKKLAALKLARHTPYRGVELTPAGEKIALEIIRHHRLIETYLAQVLGLDWDKVHDEAERWEHILSEEVEARMAVALGDPLRDPHGAPIPTLDGRIARDEWTRLSEATAGMRLTVRRVPDEDPELLRYLSASGLKPGAQVEVLRAEPVEGMLRLRVDGRPQIVGSLPADSVFVSIA